MQDNLAGEGPAARSRAGLSTGKSQGLSTDQKKTLEVSRTDFKNLGFLLELRRKRGPWSSFLMPQNSTDFQTGHSQDGVAQMKHAIHYSIQNSFPTFTLFRGILLRGLDKNGSFFPGSLVQGHKLKFLRRPNGSWRG